MIDEEVRIIIETQLERARELLRSNDRTLEAIAQALLKDETLDADQVDRIMKETGPDNSPGNLHEMKAA